MARMTDHGEVCRETLPSDRTPINVKVVSIEVAYQAAHLHK